MNLRNNSSLQDNYGRKINYLRLSVTDRCNLRCLYCQGQNDYRYLPHAQVLTYEEGLSLIGLAGSLGVSKVRLTGGEPFVRKGFVKFLEQILLSFPDLDLRLTTNGTLLSPYLTKLKQIGLRVLNISLDTLRREKYREITGQDLFPAVRMAIEQALIQGFRVKVNVVAMKGINDDELPAFVRFAIDNPLDIRFIELMPIGSGCSWSKERYWDALEIVEAIQQLTDLIPLPRNEQTVTSGPAKMYRLPAGLGRIGIISPLSNHFCATCNRFRITADGRLRTCLFSDRDYRLLPLLRSEKLGIVKVLQVMRLAARRKPLGSKLLHFGNPQQAVCQRQMRSIGG